MRPTSRLAVDPLSADTPLHIRRLQIDLLRQMSAWRIVQPVAWLHDQILDLIHHNHAVKTTLSAQDLAWRFVWLNGCLNLVDLPIQHESRERYRAEVGVLAARCPHRRESAMSEDRTRRA